MQKQFFACLIAGLVVAFAVGCGQEKAPATNSKQAANYLEIKDGTNRMVIIPKKPERIVSLSPSYLELIEAVGGQVVGRPTNKNGKVPNSMKNATEVGLTFNINMEQVVGLKPDLVLATKNQHEKFITLLEANKIATLQYNAKTIKEVQRVITDFGKIYNTSDKAKAVCDKMDKDISDIKSKLPKEPAPKKIVIMFATANSVTVAGSHSIAGCIGDILGFDNVAAKALKGKSEKTPYSMEALLEQNPDIIFITSMGKPKAIEERLQKDFQNNPAWNSLKAVQQKHIYALPENLFLLNPGIKYPEAVAYMAKKVYPDLK